MNNIYAEAVNKEARLIFARLELGRYSRLSKFEQACLLQIAERLKSTAIRIEYKDDFVKNSKWYNWFKWW